VLATEADEAGEVAIGYRPLRRITGLSLNAIRRGMCGLEQAGYVIRLADPTGTLPARLLLVTGEDLTVPVDPTARRRDAFFPERVREASDPPPSVATTDTLAVPTNLDNIDPRLLLALVRQAKDGSESASDQIVGLARQLIHEAAWKYKGQTDLEDRVQDGKLGVLRAIKRFDPARGNPFGAFTRRCIQSAMVDQVEAEPLVKVPRKSVKQFRAIQELCDELQQQLGRPATNEEVAARVGLPVEKVKELRAGMPSVETSEILDDIGPTQNDGPLDTLLRAGVPEMVRAMVASLGEPGATVLTLRFGLEGKALNVKQTARELQQSPQWVHDQTSKAIAALQTRSHADWLAEHREFLN